MDETNNKQRRILGLNPTLAKPEVVDVTQIGRSKRFERSAGVVIVRKLHKEKHEINNHFGALTEQEKESRLNALKLAKQQHFIKSPTLTTHPNHQKIEITDTSEKKDAQVTNSQDYTTTTQYAIPQYNTGKVKNLDNIVDRHKDGNKVAGTMPGNNIVSPVLNKNITRKTYDKVNKKFDLEELDEKKAADGRSKIKDKFEKKLTNNMGAKKFSSAQLTMLDAELEKEVEEPNVSTNQFPYKDDANFFRRPKKRKSIVNTKTALTEKITRDVVIPNYITVQELASRMSEKVSNVIVELMKLGVMATINHSIDANTASLIALEFGHRPKHITTEEIIQQLLNDKPDKPEDLKFRGPVVTIMGHVDHGKTSLLDALRATDIAAKEHGGITQHIGAYKVTMSNGKFITFLDTPGHEAFTAMRMRGAKITDIVVLVVAADDGIKQQTIEAIHHAQAAEVPIIVAINKIDKPGADINNVKNALLMHELIPEDMGGNVMVIPVSAHKKLGLSDLENAILLQADLLTLRANYSRLAKGSVVEAKMDKNRGATVTFLVQHGILKVGDIVVAGCVMGKIRSMYDDKGYSIKEAPPSTPVEVLGLNQPPVVGDDFIVVSNEKIAKELVSIKLQQERTKKTLTTAQSRLSIAQLFIDAKSTTKILPLIIKCDVQGSAEAIVQNLAKLDHAEIKLKIIHYAVGGITESDITLAAASKATIIGFNVRANKNAADMAKAVGVEIRYYSIIYDLLENIKNTMSGLLSPIMKDRIIGYAEIRKVFNLSKYGKIAGSYVTDGIIKRSANIRLLRDNVVKFEGKLKSLKHGHVDVREVKAGLECGIALDKWDDIMEKDTIEAFEVTQEERNLDT